MSCIVLLTDKGARERYGDSEQWASDDGIDHGAEGLWGEALRTLYTLLPLTAPRTTLWVMRDWEGCLVVDVRGDERLDTLALTDDGRIGHGGVNQPRYMDVHAFARTLLVAA